MLRTSTSGPHHIALDPPMQSLADARARLVALDREAVAGLRRSSVTVKEYRRPRSAAHVLVFLASALTWLLLARKGNTLPGSWCYDGVVGRVPRFAAFAHRVRVPVLVGMLLIHGAEAVFMARRMEKHSVPLFSLVWVAWVVSNFLEGYGAHQRFVLAHLSNKTWDRRN